jgi:lipoprotein-anchoring transpeptidase ErfK/SrfK
LQAALELKNQKKLVAARDALRQWLAENASSDLVPDAEKALGEINIQIITTPIPAPEKTDYTIQAGDSLDKIAKKFNTTVELLQKSHKLSSAVIRPNDRLRVYQGKLSVVVDKTNNTLTLFDDGKFFKKYRCGTGEYSMTPVGDFKIVDRIPNPAWWKDGKVIPFGDTNNVLGTHWLKLNVPGYGIHGTWEPASIGTQSSAGCVRLLNDDVAELFVLLPYGTPVTIKD